MATTYTADGGNISSNRYVQITSGVGGADAFSSRQLILREFTENELFPTNSVVDFTSASDVLSYLNNDDTDPLYQHAQYYFGFVSKAITQPKLFSVSRWASADTSAQVFGSQAAALDTLNGYSSAALTVTLNGASETASSIDLSTATTYADVATALQSAIQSLTGLSSATVAYNATTTAFDFDTNGAADGAVSFSSATAGFIEDLGWGSTAIFSDGIAAQSIPVVLDSSENISNNFVSISFVPDLTDEQVEAVSSWVASKNFMYMYCGRSTKSQAAAYYAALGGYGGTAMTLYDDTVTDEYPWLHPAAETAAINPDNPNAFPNYAFSPDSALSPTVTTDTEADTYDALRMNYMGRTQSAGTQLTWYQTGVLMGGTDSATQMSAYVAEVWNKTNIQTHVLNALNALPGISADESGESLVSIYMEQSAQDSIDNGCISVGGTLTVTQRAYITQITGIDNAWKNVQQEGYYYTFDFESETATNGTTQYILHYTLVYKKRDMVNKVEGRHILI